MRKGDERASQFEFGFWRVERVKGRERLTVLGRSVSSITVETSLEGRKRGNRGQSSIRGEEGGKERERGTNGVVAAREEGNRRNGSVRRTGKKMSERRGELKGALTSNQQ